MSTQRAAYTSGREFFFCVAQVQLLWVLVLPPKKNSSTKFFDTEKGFAFETKKNLSSKKKYFAVQFFEIFLFAKTTSETPGTAKNLKFFGPKKYIFWTRLFV
jgi:hypothetical protein